MIEIDFIYSIIGTPLGYIMYPLYLLVNNFGWAVIIFTLVVKLASFPLSLKQQKNMAVSQLFTPRVQEIQKKYRSNQQKMQEEMAKLQKEGYNPMGGCGPMILTLIILFGVIDVVYKPMTHMEHFDWTEKNSTSYIKDLGKQTECASIILSSEKDAAVVLEFAENRDAYKKSDENPQIVYDENKTFTAVGDITNDQRLDYGRVVADNLDILTASDSRLSDEIKGMLRPIKTSYGGLYGELRALQQFSNSPDAFSSVNPEISEKLIRLSQNMIFFGIDLGKTPNFSVFDNLWIVVIVSFLLAVIQTVVTQIIQKKSSPELAAAGGAGMKAMFFMQPLISLFIVFTVPAGAGLYWSISYLFAIAQSFIIYKFWPPEKLREEARAKGILKNSAVNATATIVDVDEEGNEVVKKEKLTDLSSKEQKEYFRKKLEEARKADLEKYGDVPDIDLSEYDKPQKDDEISDKTPEADVSDTEKADKGNTKKSKKDKSSESNIKPEQNNNGKNENNEG